MIKVLQVSKRFDDITALDKLSLDICEGQVFGLLGTNGAGKSTLMRLISGVYKPNEGTITIDDLPVFDNPEASREIFYISDDAFFFQDASPLSMMEWYASFYKNFNRERFIKLLSAFNLEPKRLIRTYSKGMKKQLSILLGLCAGTKWLFCDETFDGLDPVMRQAVKSLMASEMCDRNFTPVIASHNLRELEDICDHVGLLHKGGVLLSKNLDDMKENLHKYQLVSPAATEEYLYGELDVLSYVKRGSLITLTVRGDAKELQQFLKHTEPVFLEELPLTLEEIFINETGVYGYDIKNLIL